MLKWQFLPSDKSECLNEWHHLMYCATLRFVFWIQCSNHSNLAVGFKLDEYRRSCCYEVETWKQLILHIFFFFLTLQADLCVPRLNEGDQVVLINGRDIAEHTHDQVVMFIKASCERHSGELVLLVRPNGEWFVPKTKNKQKRHLVLIC